MGFKIRSQLGNICDSSFNCEMSDLESLCEEVLEDEETFISRNNTNDNELRFRRKRNIVSSISSTPTSLLMYSTNAISSKAPRNFNRKRILSKNSNRRAFMKLRARLQMARQRNKRRRRRRSRIKILFKMIGGVEKIVN